MYNEQLAFAVLYKLNEAFPSSMDEIQLMKSLPEFSTVPRTDWIRVLEALEKLQHIKGTLVWAGVPRQILRAFNLEITQLGQSYLEQSEREKEDANQGVTSKMGKRAQSSSPGASTPPTIKPQQAIPLLRQQIQRLGEIMKLHHDDPRVDAWESTTENILNAVYGLPNGEMHPNTSKIIEYLARGTLWYVGMRDEDSQRSFVQSQQKRKALLEAYIEQLEMLSLAAPSQREAAKLAETHDAPRRTVRGIKALFPKGTKTIGARGQAGQRKQGDEHEWDVFISHASEDKDAIARPLAQALQARGLRVWYDEFSLTVGDSLRESIDYGLAHSEFGVVILSEHFFEKHWPTQELNGLATREVNGKKVILPVWHGVGFEQVRQYSPTLANRVAVTTEQGVGHVVEQLLGAMK